jgi:hypothetical protein
VEELQEVPVEVADKPQPLESELVLLPLFHACAAEPWSD